MSFSTHFRRVYIREQQTVCYSYNNDVNIKWRTFFYPHSNVWQDRRHRTSIMIIFISKLGWICLYCILNMENSILKKKQVLIPSTEVLALIPKIIPAKYFVLWFKDCWYSFFFNKQSAGFWEIFKNRQNKFKIYNLFHLSQKRSRDRAKWIKIWEHIFVGDQNSKFSMFKTPSFKCSFVNKCKTMFIWPAAAARLATWHLRGWTDADGGTGSSGQIWATEQQVGHNFAHIYVDLNLDSFISFHYFYD